jgi:beta-N-acetylhexosaminidase
VQTGQHTLDELQTSVARITRLKKWLSEHAIHPDLSVVRSAEHMQVADEIAERSITLVRDDRKFLPLSLDADKKIAVIIPTPKDLTHADTSSYVQPRLADFIREHHAQTDEFKISYAPDEGEVASVLERIRGYDAIIVGTINAYTEDKQVEFVRQLLEGGKHVIIVAMRLPYDLAAFPQASTFICTYGIPEPSMRAAARALRLRGDEGSFAGIHSGVV